jgi:cell division protease FtsH
MLNANPPREPAGTRQQGGPPGGAPGTPPAAPRFPSIWVILAVLFIVNYLVVTFLFPSASAPTEIPYDAFLEQVERGNVEQVSTRADTIQGTLREAITLPPAGEATTPAGEAVTLTRFTTVMPAFVNTDLERLLLEQDVVIDATSIEIPRNPLVTFLLSFGPALLLIGLFIWLSRRMQGGLGGAFSLGKSRAQRYDETGERVTFNDVTGIDEARNELVEIVDFLRNPSKYTRLGGTAPKGVLLVGAPGTGKTLLAKAVAGEAGVPFFSMNASEFVEMIVGVGASRVRDLFRQAREAAPAIIFIDELDAIGRARGRQSFGGSSEQEQTLNQILTEMDGFSSREGVIVLAATNRPDVLDPALLRAGRFDRRVAILPPDRLGREKILEVHTRSVPLAADVSLGEVAQITPGLVGADLRNLVNEAALLAARREQDSVRQRDFTDALEKLILGPERVLLMSELDRKRVAYHEGGHAILGLVVPGADPVSRVTITPRGMSLGVTYQRPEDDRYNYPEAYLRARIIGALGGRAAEMIIFGDRTTGAENDLEQVTSLAQRMVTRWGMSDQVGLLALGPKEDRFLNAEVPFGPEGKPYSEATAELVDSEVRRIVEECYEQALKLLEANRAALDRLAEALLERETLDEAGVLAVTGLKPAPTAG